jgi:hypothetical protein
VKAMDCGQVVELAPELALDIVCGVERAAALAHLDSCGSCQHVVSSLTGVTDQLLQFLTPSVEPPPGFERQVLAPLVPAATAAAQPRRRRPPAWIGALAAAACIVALTLVLALSRPNGTSLVAADMTTTGGDVVGTAYVQEQPAVLAMDLPGWSARLAAYGQPADAYSVRIERADGPMQLVPVAVNASSSWATALDVDPHSITSVAVVDRSGHVWCEASFTPVR